MIIKTPAKSKLTRHDALPKYLSMKHLKLVNSPDKRRNTTSNKKSKMQDRIIDKFEYFWYKEK
jgi:hypothetical protein